MEEDSRIFSLTNSFSSIPPAAIPAVIDCVLASASLTSSSLLSSLLRSFPDPKEVNGKNQILAHFSALCYLIKKVGDFDALREFVWKVFVPVVRVVEIDDHEMLNQIEESMFYVVSTTRAWNLMEETLVPYCLSSVGLSVGMLQNHELAVYKWSTNNSLEIFETLTLPFACRILTFMLQCALRSEMRVPNVRQKLEGFPANILWDLSNLALGMLMRSMEDRSLSIRLLLPSMFKLLNLFRSVDVFVLGSPYTLSSSSFAKDIWNCCISLFSSGARERQDAYLILSLYFSSYYSQEMQANRNHLSKEFDVTDENAFWVEVRRGLVDHDATMRKQALYILKLALSNYTSSCDVQSFADDLVSVSKAKNETTISCNGTSAHPNMSKKGKWAEKEAKSLGVGEVSDIGDHCLSSQDRWKVFVLLYEMLEEYGTHLVEAAWTHQIVLLLQSMPQNNILPVTFGTRQVQMETIESVFGWLAVLWERGFFHDNPQVRCLIMESLLSIDWDKDGNYATKVPKSFVLGPLLMGLDDVVHHKDFGVSGSYTSRTIQGATKYFNKLSSQMSLSERTDFILSLASVGKRESFSRAGLMTFASCIAASACPSDTYNMIDYSSYGRYEFQLIECTQNFSNPSRGADLLDVLGFIIECSKQHFNANYRLQVCQQVIKAAASLINISCMPLGVVLHFFSTIPREFTDSEGTLRAIVQHWLTHSSIENGFGSCATKESKLNELFNFPMSFVRKENSLDCSFNFDDEDVEAWTLDAQRWARVLFLVTRNAQHLDTIFMFVRSRLTSPCKKDGVMEWAPIKLFILVLSLVEELQVEWRKFKSYTGPKARREHDGTGERSFSPNDWISIHGQLASIMMELIAFSKLLSPVVWSVSEAVDCQLPQSLTGKLGGPSHRRLPSSTTSSVIQEIFQLRNVACVSSLCTLLGRDDRLDQSFTFLWDFCWKAVQPQVHNSEISAELCLARYEALAYVFKEWTPSFTPSVFDSITAYTISVFGVEDNLVLDVLVNTFMLNINDLLSNGVLTRSRRAVLMDWKWLCLDSLLSVPFNFVKNGGDMKKASAFFSEPTVRSIFSDIVDSLENAGESSALHILRSLRLVVGFLCSGNASPMTSSDLGVTCEMMEQVTHNSWVLHLSCNKRRVAPIAALLSAVLHQSVFGDIRMHEPNGSQLGPLKRFTENLLREGLKSPRTIRLAALHLTGLWLLHPKTVKYYIEELKLLSLYGSVAFDEDFEAELSENHEARTEVSLLAQTLDNELCEVFINTELYARVSVAVLFFKLANLANSRGEHDGDSLAALESGKMFLLEMLDFAVNDKDLAKELYKKHSAIHRRKVRTWQMICILSHFVDKDIVEEVTSNFHICLCRNNLPAVRQYLEMFAIHIYLRFPMLAKKQLVPIFHDHSMRPQALSSYVFIAANIIIHASNPQVQRTHLNDLLPAIIPLLTSHHHSLRAFTQLLVHNVLCKSWPSLKDDNLEESSLERKCFEDLKIYLAENNDCKRLRKSMEGFLDAFDPITCATPAGVFNARKEGSGFECVPVSLMDQVTGFLNNVRDDLRHSMAKDVMALSNEAITELGAGNNREEAVDAVAKDLPLDFQKKITLDEHLKNGTNNDTHSFYWNTELPILLSEIEMEDQLFCPILESRIRSMEKTKGSQQELIVVASLVDRIPNLAGLARTCEVFKVAGFAIAKTNILQDKQFQLISVTADKWVPIIEVPVHTIKNFLEKKRREGYSIIGLEQTANSSPIDQYLFQNKTVLVLGQEKEGIPVDIIHVLDACIEIPQLGIIRSLNVHVSGAIAMWEYTRQQRSRQT